MTADHIRVWLEPGYDGGRFGAWMLDLPGCFLWRDERDQTLDAVPAGVREFTAWLAKHGEASPEAARLTASSIEIVEEVSPTWVGDYERNATFAADHRPVLADDLDRTLRWLDHARADLVPVLDRLSSREAAHGPLPTAGRAREERATGETLRHLAGAEVWLAGRLDGSARYDGPAPDDIGVYLRETREWATAQVRALQQRDPTIERTDGKGETWTLAKVLRRLVYHSLDHLDELERRLTA